MRKKSKTIAELFAEIENTPIAVAVAPLRKLAKKEAKERAMKVVQHVAEELGKAGNDVNLAAPYPRSHVGSQYEYMAVLNKYYLFNKLTTWRKGSYNHHEPHYADMDAEKIQDYIDTQIKFAEEKYKQYVYKLTLKIGHTTSAKLDTFSKESLWYESLLHVVLISGKKQSWKTKMIWNRSCLGKDFPQFPTRLFDGVKTKAQVKGLR